MNLLDFAQLNQARDGLDKANALRHEQSDQLYQRGRQCLREGLRRPVDKTRLNQAADCFSKGIQSNYKNPANYLGLAFLLLLTGQAPQAVPLIKTALEHVPDSELAQELLAQAQRPPGPRPNQPARKVPADAAPIRPTSASAHDLKPLAPPDDSGGIDYDALFETTQTEIRLFHKQLIGFETVLPKPEPEPRRLVMLQDRIARFREKAGDFEQQVELLDAEFDVQMLRAQLQSSEQVLARLSAQLQHFETFIQIDRELRERIAETSALTAQTPTSVRRSELVSLEAQLQILLDHCDRIADQLDEFEARQIDIQPLYGRYKAFVDALECYQDAIEEAQEQLKARSI